MSVDAEHHVGFEIGHVLFIDIVGYSKRLVNEQTDRGSTSLVNKNR